MTKTKETVCSFPGCSATELIAICSVGGVKTMHLVCEYHYIWGLARAGASPSFRKFVQSMIESLRVQEDPNGNYVGVEYAMDAVPSYTRKEGFTLLGDSYEQK